MNTANTHDLLLQLLLGGVLGMLGQILRSAAGMKKIHDTAVATGQSFGDIFEGSQLVMSLLIGFGAGALAILMTGSGSTVQALDRNSLITIIAAGYSGSDFIESIVTRKVPASDTPPPPPAQPPAMG